ncbi:MAG: GldG family protein [Clostridia bacterium]|nr:GldG family protein [Clostridia bacterium]
MGKNENGTAASRISRHRRLRFGALAVGITVAVVALVVLANAIFSAFAKKYTLYIDMTKEKVFSITDTTRDLLDGLRGKEDFHIDIIFCNDADSLDSDYSSRLVHNLAQEYDKEFDFVNVRYVDIINHPSALNRYLATSLSGVKTTSVIITDGSASRLFSMQSFYTFDSDTGNVFAFNGEYKTTAAILQLAAADSPVAYFLTGHGETDEDVALDGPLSEMFTDAGYIVEQLNLQEADFSENGKVMVIANPKYDFWGADDTVNEIAKIDRFLTREGKGRGLMVFMDKTTGPLENLDEYLNEWGIRFENSQIRDYSSSLNVDGTELVATYVTDEKELGASLTSTIRSVSNPPKAVIKDARPITMTFTDKSAVVGSSVREESAVLTTSPDRTAAATDLSSSSEPVSGVYNLMVVSVDSRYIDNEPDRNYVVAVGGNSMNTSKYIGSKSYANRDIMFSLMKTFSRVTVPSDINFKVFEDTDLNITQAEAYRYTFLYTVIPALIVAGIGVYVYVRRKTL